MTAPLPELQLASAPLLEALTHDAPPRLPDDWTLSSAMAHHEGGVLLVLTRTDTRRTLGLQVRRRNDDAPAWLRTPHLDLITHIPADVPEAEGLRVLTPLAERLRALDGPDTALTVATGPGVTSLRWCGAWRCRPAGAQRL